MEDLTRHGDGMSARIVEGVILVYDREARSELVRAFKRAGWKPVRPVPDSVRREAMRAPPNDRSAIYRLLYMARGYEYLSSSACHGDTPRYRVSGTEEEVERLMEELSRSDTRGIDAYVG